MTVTGVLAQGKASTVRFVRGHKILSAVTVAVFLALLIANVTLISVYASGGGAADSDEQSTTSVVAETTASGAPDEFRVVVGRVFDAVSAETQGDDDVRVAISADAFRDEIVLSVDAPRDSDKFRSGRRLLSIRSLDVDLRRYRFVRDIGYDVRDLGSPCFRRHHTCAVFSRMDCEAAFDCVFKDLSVGCHCGSSSGGQLAVQMPPIERGQDAVWLVAADARRFCGVWGLENVHTGPNAYVCTSKDSGALLQDYRLHNVSGDPTIDAMSFKFRSFAQCLADSCVLRAVSVFGGKYDTPSVAALLRWPADNGTRLCTFAQLPPPNLLKTACFDVDSFAESDDDATPRNVLLWRSEPQRQVWTVAGLSGNESAPHTLAVWQYGADGWLIQRSAPVDFSHAFYLNDRVHFTPIDTVVRDNHIYMLLRRFDFGRVHLRVVRFDIISGDR